MISKEFIIEPVEEFMIPESMIPHEDTIKAFSKIDVKELLDIKQAFKLLIDKELGEKMAILAKEKATIEIVKKKLNRKRKERENDDPMNNYKKQVKKDQIERRNELVTATKKGWKPCKMCKRSINRVGKKLITKYYSGTTCQYCYRKTQKGNKEERLKDLFSEKQDELNTESNN